MALFIVWAAFHYQIFTQPVFRPSLALIRGHQVVSVVESHDGAEMRPPDGAMVDWRLEW